MNDDQKSSEELIAELAILRQKVAELEAHRVDESRFRDVVQNQTDMICHYNLELEITFVNDAYCHVFEGIYDDFIGQSILSTISPDDSEHVKHHIAQLTSNHPIATSEYRTTMPDGTHRWFQWHDQALMNDKGEIIEYQGVGRDITERKQMEKQLHYQSALIDVVSDAIISTDVNIIIQSWNPAAEAMYGWTAQEVIGKQLEELVLPKYPNSNREEIASILVTDGYYNGEVIHHHKDGSRIHIWGSITMLRDDNQNPIGTVIANRDITERKQAEEALRQRQSELEAILDVSQNILFILKPDGTITDYRISSESDLYIQPEEFLNKRMQDVLPPDIEELFEKTLTIVAETQAKQTVEYQLEMPNVDTPQWYEAVLSPNQQRVTLVIRNITERKQTEEALLVSQRQFYDLFNKNRDGYGINIGSGRILEANPAFAKMLGYSIDELKEISIWDLTPEKWIQWETEHQGSKLLKRGYSDLYEKEYIRKDGTIFPAQVQAFLLNDAEDLQSALIGGFIRDITKRKQAEATLEKSEQKYRDLYDNAPDMFVSVDAATAKIIQCNQTFATATGYTIDEIMGRHISEMYHPDSEEKRQKIFQQFLKTGEVRNAELALKRKEGSKIPISLNVIAIRDEKGKILHSRSICRDITKHKQAEKTLQESEERFRNLIETAPLGIIVSDKTGMILTINDMAEQLLGYDRSELVEQSIDILLPDAIHTIHAHHRQNYFSNPTIRLMGVEQDLMARRKDDTKFPIEVALSYIQIGGNDFATCFISDITKRKQVENALRESENKLKEAQQVAKLGHYVFDIKTGDWASSDELDNIFGIDETFQRNIETWLQIVHPDFKETMSNYLQDDVMRQHQKFDKVYKVVNRITQQEKWVHGLGNLKFDEQNNPIEMFGTIQDITEGKLAEEAIKTERNILRILIDTLPDIISVKDTDGKFIVANKALAEYVGVSTPSELIGKTDFDFYSAERAHIYDKDEQLIIQTGQSLVDKDESDKYPQTAEFKYLLTSKLPYRSNEGEILGIVIVARDVTKRRLAEEQLRKLSRAVEQSANIIMITNIDGIIEYVNPYFTRLTGYSFEEVVGQKPSLLKSGHTSSEEYTHLWKTIVLGGEWRGEFHNRKKNGELYWERASISPIRDESGNITHFLAVKEDVTSLKQREWMIAQRNRELSTLNSIADIANKISDPDTILEIALQQLADLTDVESAECHLLDDSGNLSLATTWNMDDAFSVASRDYHFPIGEGIPGLAYAYRTPIYIADATTDTRYWRRDLAHASGYRSLLCIPIVGSDSIMGTIMLYSRETREFPQSLQDVLMTVGMRLALVIERAQLFNTLQMSEAKYRDLVETSQGLIWRFDLEGCFTYLNPAWEVTLGYPLEEMLGRKLSKFKTPEVGVRDMEKFYSVRDGKSIVGYETTYITKSGDEVNLVFNAKPYYDLVGNIIGTQGTAYDVTERKQAEVLSLENEHLKTQFQKEQEQNALIQRIISTLSHDMRTPLSVISISRDMLALYFDKMTAEKRQEKLDTIEHQIQFSLQLLDDTVQTARGRHEFHPALVNLATLCQISVDETHSIRNENHQLIFDNIGEVETVFIDETLVSRILLNLISNAIKYSPEGGEIRLELNHDEDWIILSVIDYGMGMHSDDLPHIFDLLYRANNVGNILGTGLGLSIAKDCVERHQGDIIVQSEVGKGSIFTVKLPK